MFPKKGNSFPARRSAGLAVAAAIGGALREELGNSARAAKTVARWTGASVREAKHWLAGSHVPDGQNLILLAKHSDAVLYSVLQLASRDPFQLNFELKKARMSLLQALSLIDALELKGDVGRR
jgi:hypothetical protein